MRKIVIAAVAAGTIALGATYAEASTLGDFVDYGRVAGNISCYTWGCYFDLKNTVTGKVVRPFVTEDAMIKYCQKHGFPDSTTWVTSASLGLLKNAQANVAVIWSKHTSNDTQPGAITCK